MRRAAVLLALLAACGGEAPQDGNGGNDNGATEDPPPLICPVCGTGLAQPTRLTTEHGGKTFYFDRGECRDRFTAEPARQEWATGLAGQGCICTLPGPLQMLDCRCEHCSGDPVPCPCQQ